jgi:hypothetical protein
MKMENVEPTTFCFLYLNLFCTVRTSSMYFCKQYMLYSFMCNFLICDQDPMHFEYEPDSSIATCMHTVSQIALPRTSSTISESF